MIKTRLSIHLAVIIRLYTLTRRENRLPVCQVALAEHKQDVTVATAADKRKACLMYELTTGKGTPGVLIPQQNTASVVMDVRNITKRLPLGREHIDILKGLSFQVRSGEFLAIVGPSGSGKSTLLGIIAGLDNPSSGQVFIDQIEITRMREGQLAAIRNCKIGMVFQSFNLIPTLTAQENVEVPLYVGKHRGAPSTRAKELLGLVGLSHRLRHRPNQLSGGEQQRVAIARALATDPALVIADEPTGNLDMNNGEKLLKLIADLRMQTGKTFLIASHDPRVASHADRILHIVDGMIAVDDGIDGEMGRMAQ